MSQADAELRNWSITVDYVPGQNWEAAIESGGDYGPGGYEADNPHDLLAAVAADLQAEVGIVAAPPRPTSSSLTTKATESRRSDGTR